jgi:chitodextrinase
VTSVTWHTVAVASDTAYRYLRFYTPSGNANVAELELFERTVDRTLLELLAGRGAEENPDLWTEASFAELADALERGTVVLDDAAAAQPDVDAAADAIDTALTGLVPLDRWSATATYHVGDRVLHDGRVFVALWWTRGDVPGESARGAWAELGAQIVCNAGEARAWTPSWVYSGGEVAVHDGHRWEAQWWSRDQEPGDTGRGSPWHDLGGC